MDFLLGGRVEGAGAWIVPELIARFGDADAAVVVWARRPRGTLDVE